MDPFVQQVTTGLATGILLLQVVLVVAVIKLFVLRQPGEAEPFFKTHGLVLAFLLTLGASLMSLWYSEFVGFPVCKFCWLGRIAMYPLALILGIAWYQHDLRVWRYAMPLAVFGAAITLIHWLSQMLTSFGVSCGAAVGDVSCTQQLVSEYGYITFPMFGLTTFLWAIFLFIFVRKAERDEHRPFDRLRSFLSGLFARRAREEEA